MIGFSAIALVLTLPAQQQVECEPGDRYCAEVRALRADARVQQAFDYLHRTDERALEELIALTEIPAPPFGEERRAARYAEMLRDAGADSVWIDDEGNVLALRRGNVLGGSAVAMGGHLDTVFPEGTDVSVELRGDTLFAPGVGDDTRGLILVLQVLRALEVADIDTRSDVLFVGTVGEEGLGDLRGMKHLFRDGGPDIDAFIAVDGGDDNRIVHQGLGSHRYRVTFRGPGGHSWGAFGTANPAHALGRAIATFDSAGARYTAEGVRTSYNVGRIGGGTSVNSIPFEAWMEVDMRSESQARLNEIDSIFQRSVRRALEAENAGRLADTPLTVDVEMVGDRPSGETPVTSPLVQRMIAVLRADGLEPELDRSSTDANVPIARGVPAITISRGGAGGNAHAPDEWWVNQNGVAAIERALVLLLAQAGADPAAR
ncbi:MAG: M20/M25/M40 family metallo-hydrolase [Longimicrobiales bacterium]